MTMTQSNGSNLLVQGRIIWTLGSNLFEGKQKTNMQTKAVIVGNDGKPVVEYGFGLAVPKIDPRTGQHTQEFTKLWNALHTEAFTLFPSGQIPPTFAMKFKDGDTAIDDKGQPYSKREGYAGHIVLSCTTQIPIKYFIFEGGNNILVNTGIKNGDYVNVQLNIKAHPAVGQSKAGLYVNPSAVQLIQPGKEIINTPSGDQIFGQALPQYVGQVETPVHAPMPGTMAPAYGQPAMQTPVAPAYAQPAMQTPVAAPQAPAHYGVLPETMQPPQAPAYGQAVTNGLPPMPGMPR
jgi:hypothetical protein